jgi:adenylyltransferase/sulfurtransferase
LSNSRYDRQRRFAAIGEDGQLKIENARVLIIGVGALGSVVAELLGRAGVGFLRIVDRDTVEWSNLQRQSLYTEADAREGLAKVQATANHLAEINRSVITDPIASDVTAANIASFANHVDVMVDGTDNFETRFLINDIAWQRRIPWVHGGCLGASGQAFAFQPGKTICFRCLVPKVPDPTTIATCDTAGVLGPATHLIASLQAIETLKVLVQKPIVSQHLTSVDLWASKFRSIDTSQLRSGACPVCDLERYDFLSGSDGQSNPLVLCGRNAVQLPPRGATNLSLERIAENWVGLGKIDQTRFLVRLHVSESQTITLFRDGRAVVSGTEDPATARTIYARFVGG